MILLVTNLKLAIDEDVVIAHMISGLAYEVCEALRFLDIRVVHGIHFWRDMLVSPTPSSGYYPDVDEKTAPKVEF